MEDERLVMEVEDDGVGGATGLGKLEGAGANSPGEQSRSTVHPE